MLFLILASSTHALAPFFYLRTETIKDYSSIHFVFFLQYPVSAHISSFAATTTWLRRVALPWQHLFRPLPHLSRWTSGFYLWSVVLLLFNSCIVPCNIKLILHISHTKRSKHFQSLTSTSRLNVNMPASRIWISWHCLKGWPELIMFGHEHIFHLHQIDSGVTYTVRKIEILFFLELFKLTLKCLKFRNRFPFGKQYQHE